MTAERRSPSFVDLFGAPPVAQAVAPGRVNLIGEHTDYNGGFVLPAAIPQRTLVEAKPHAGGSVVVWSRDIGTEGEEKAYDLGSETPQHDWLDHVRGITRTLVEAGHRLGGFQLRIESTVPVGSGVSSSAALQIAVLRALRALFALRLDEVELALLAHRVENEFVGAPVGIMDQMACALADESHALFLDTRSRTYERVALPEGTGLIVIDSGVAHRHAGGGYRTRREECDRAASLLGVAELRDVQENPQVVANLPPPLDRRARHVVTENARVLATVQAFRAQDPAAAGRLLSSSHLSMRDDFEVSIPEIDLLVTLAGQHPDVFGARLTGGGFGGSIVALARAGATRGVAELVAAAYQARTGLPGRVLVPEPLAPGHGRGHAS